MQLPREVRRSMLLTKRQVCRKLKLSESTIAKLIRTGELAVVRPSERAVRIADVDLARFIEERRHAGSPGGEKR